MKKFPSLSRRILRYMILVGLLPVLLMSVENYLFGKNTIEDSENGHIGYALKSRLTFLDAWLHHTKKEFYYAAKSSCTISDCAGEKEHTSQLNPTCKSLQTVMRGHAIYQYLAVYDNDWSVLVTTGETRNIAIPPPSDELKELFANAKGFITGPVTFSGGKAILPICQPTLDEKGLPLAYTVGYLDIRQSLDRILGKSSDIGETGKFVLLSRDGIILWAPENMRSLIGTRTHVPESLYLGPYKIMTHYRDRNGTKVLGITAPTEEDVPWLLLAQIEEAEAYQILTKRLLVSLMVGIGMLILIALVCVRLSGRLSRPLNQLSRVAQKISGGRVKERAPEFYEQEPREVGIAFNTMLDRLSESQRALARSATLAAVGELSSSIAHEMRNPLSSMKINLESLAEKLKDDPVYSEITDISIQQTQRLENMLSDLMKYGAPIELKLEQTTFAKLAENVLQVLENEAAAKDIVIRIDNRLDQCFLLLDIELMTRALINLVNNAIQWAPVGGEVELSGSVAPDEYDWASILVSDNGPGISEGQREKLFNLFYSTREGGNGIGLANVKKIIEYHGGFVAGDNAETQGAVFSILLPIGGPDN